MPPNPVEVSFWPGEGRGARLIPDLSGLGELISEVFPLQIAIEAVATPQSGVSCQLEAAFAAPAVNGVDFAQAFKRSVIRLEGESGYQAFWGKHVESEMSNWAYLRPTQPSPRLPSGKPFAFALQLAPVARRLFDRAPIRDNMFSYRIELARVGRNIDLLRPLIPALAELQQGNESARGLAPGLKSLLDLARQEGWYAIETFGAAPQDMDAREWLEEAIVQHVTASFPVIQREEMDLRWSSEVSLTIPQDPQGYASGLRPRDYVQSVINSISGTTGGARVSQLPSFSTSANLDARASSRIGHDYAFVSYAHKNSDFAGEVAQYLDRSGINYWRDDGIDPGNKWDEKLEEQIANCNVLIACLSQEYQLSKYCRRELKFADFMGKPIVPIAQAPISWSDGLRFMFQELQICSVSSDAGWEKLKSGLACAASGIFTRSS
jgi:TIR domain